MEQPAFKQYNSHTQRKPWAAAYARYQYQHNPEYRAKSKLRHYQRIFKDDDFYRAVIKNDADPVVELRVARRYRQWQKCEVKKTNARDPPNYRPGEKAVCSTRSPKLVVCPQMRIGDVIENNMVEVAEMITSHAPVEQLTPSVPGAKAVCSTHFG